MKKTISFIIIILSVLFFLTSCSDLMGYSVLLWSLPEQGLSDGDVVPVYIKSSISQVYVIGIPNTKEKIEVPLWQISTPVSKRKLNDTVELYSDYQHQYAKVAIDGLPMRAESVNTAKQIYRLRKDEVIKVLYKGNGAKPMTGQTALEGDWLRVMASDGTKGWCFSYNLRLFDERESDNDGQEQSVEKDVKLESILGSYWYPESYVSIIKSGLIDLERMKVEYGFDPGRASGTTRFCYSGINVSYPFDGVTQEKENTYRFNGVPLAVTYRTSDLIVVQYTNEKGIPQSFNMVTIEESIPTIVSDEVTRRADMYNLLLTTGPIYSSSSYGTLEFYEGNTFKWQNFSLLADDVIPTGALNTGSIEIKYLLDSSLTYVYDGVLTFKFDGTSKEVNFLYQFDMDGLRFEDASGAVSRGNIILRRNPNPVTLFFYK